MSDLELIYLILAAFYLAECGLWVRPGSLLFVSQFGERCRMRNAHTGALLHNDHGGLLFGNFLPWGHSFLTHLWPLSLAPSGIASFTRQSLTPDQRPEGEKTYLPWDQVRNVRVEGRVLHIADQPFVAAASAEQAKFLASLLTRLAGLDDMQRAQAILEAVQRTFDAATFVQTFRAAGRRSLVLMLACTALLLYVFAAVPWLLARQIFADFLGILPGYFSLLLLTIFVYHRTHRALGRDRSERWSSTWMMLVSPADAIHCRDRLLRPFAAGYHPLAAAFVLSHPNDLGVTSPPRIDNRLTS